MILLMKNSKCNFKLFSFTGTCPFTKDNVSWGEYQTKILMPSGMSSPYTVIMKFDAVTTIVS